MILAALIAFKGNIIKFMHRTPIVLPHHYKNTVYSTVPIHLRGLYTKKCCAFSAKITFKQSNISPWSNSNIKDRTYLHDFEEEFIKALAQKILRGLGEVVWWKKEGIKSHVTVPLKVKFMGEIVGAKFRKSYGQNRNKIDRLFNTFKISVGPTTTQQNCMPKWFSFVLSLHLHMLLKIAASSLVMP
jgi:hypothetical protein